MAVFTFVCRNKGGLWTAKQHAGDGNLEGSAATPYELQQQLRNAALQTAGAGAVSVDFSLISPSSAVLQVIVGGGGGGGAIFSSGGGAAAPAPSAGASAPAAEEPKKEEEKEESDDDMGFSLFD